MFQSSRRPPEFRAAPGREAEIAARLQEPAGAIKSRLHRARALVREYLLGPETTPPKLGAGVS